MKRIKTEGWIKLVLTVALSIYSLVVAIITHNSGVFASMFSSTGGDIEIMASRDALGTGKDKTQFTKGVVFFSAAHFLYVLSMMRETKDWIIIVGLEVILFLVICAIAYATNFKSTTILNVCYAMCLLLATINAWRFSVIAGVGYISFAISDIILVVKEDKEPYWQIPIWIFYVLGQILIITSFMTV